MQVLRGQGFASENVTKPLQQLLDNLTSYAPFLPDSLFTRLHNTEALRGTPNETLEGAMEGKTASVRSVESCARRLRDPSYTLLAFARDVETEFPELILYTTAETLSSGLDARDDFERTMGALYATYCLLRLDLDGKEIFSFGVDASGCALREPKDHHKKLEFYSTMNWPAVTDLVVRADLLRLDARGKIWVESVATFWSHQGETCETRHNTILHRTRTRHAKPNITPKFPRNHMARICKNKFRRSPRPHTAHVESNMSRSCKPNRNIQKHHKLGNSEVAEPAKPTQPSTSVGFVGLLVLLGLFLLPCWVFPVQRSSSPKEISSFAVTVLLLCWC